MKKTNFDLYVEEQMWDPAFAARFERAGEALDHLEHHFNADALIRSVEEIRDHLRGARRIALRLTDVPCLPPVDEIRTNRSPAGHPEVLMPSRAG